MEFSPIKHEFWPRVKAIYQEAFPRLEQKPFFLLKRSRKVQLFIATEGTQLLGFIAAIPMGDLVMVDYLAVDSKIRSKGTGSFLLRELCQQYATKTIVLLIEALNDSAPNAQQRIARRKFYLKNGFTSSSLYVQGASGVLEVLNFNGTVTAQAYLALQKYALGSLLFRLSKMQLVDSQECA